MTHPALRPLIISAPFGNYIQPADTTPTLGTFTAAARGGRIMQVLKTVRYYPRLRAWVNKIGLRNPGIDWLATRVQSGKISVADKLVSIHGFTADDWYTLLDKTAALRPLGIELNISCPNVGEIDWPDDLFTRAAACGSPIVVKLPPVNYHDLFAQSIGAGLRSFHCCNTLPVPAGGISGKPLKPVALQCIRDIQQIAGDRAAELLIIGGGGITAPVDIDEYRAAGATHFAVGTKVFSPRYLVSHAGLAPLIKAAG